MVLYYCREQSLVDVSDIFQKNVRNPNHHYFSKKYRNTPPICIAIRLQVVPQYFWCPLRLRSEERETLSVLLPFVSQYASHLYCSTPPICIAILLGKSRWLWSPECSPIFFFFAQGGGGEGESEALGGGGVSFSLRKTLTCKQEIPTVRKLHPKWGQQITLLLKHCRPIKGTPPSTPGQTMKDTPYIWNTQTHH